MSLLTIAANVATNVSAPVPSTVLSNTDADAVKIVRFTQATADELARRVDWAALRTTTTITGTGSNDDFDLPSDFGRLIPGNAVNVAGVPVRVGLSADEWASLTPAEGTPRYARLIGSKMSFFPYPALGTTVSITYQSKNWCENGTTWGADSDTALVPETLIEQGTIWRWRRQQGQDFQDYLAEYEAALKDYAAFDDGIRSP